MAPPERPAGMAPPERRLREVKHIVVVSTKVPGEAALWQEAVCQSAHILMGVITAKGGTVPMLGYIDTKCDLPVPNTSGTGT